MRIPQHGKYAVPWDQRSLVAHKWAPQAAVHSISNLRKSVRFSFLKRKYVIFACPKRNAILFRQNISAWLPLLSAPAPGLGKPLVYRKKKDMCNPKSTRPVAVSLALCFAPFSLWARIHDIRFGKHPPYMDYISIVSNKYEGTHDVDSRGCHTLRDVIRS